MQTTHSYTHCRFGVATRDVTPPVGIYARSWGAATHEVAEGVHRPFAATAAVFAPVAGDEPTLALVAVDLGWFQYLPDERDLRATILRRTGIEDAALLINMSHTHAGANVNSQLKDKPGVELIQPYIEHLTEQISAAILEARDTVAPAWVTYGTGRSALATNRDSLGRRRRSASPRGYNPDAPADDTLVVAQGHRRRRRGARDAVQLRLPPDDPRLGEPAAVARLHRRRPRGAGERLRRTGPLPPGRVGRARPARRLRRRHGRRRSQRPPARPFRRGCDREPAAAGTRFVYTGIVASGANLGTWEYQPADEEQLRASEQLAARVDHVELAARKASESSTASRTRLPTRCRSRRRRCAAASSARRSATIRSTRCRSGRGGSARRCWSPSRTSPTRCFQVELRRRFAGTPLLVLGVTNRTMGYLSPEETYGTGLYQEQQSPFAPGCLEQTIEVAATALGELRD